MLTININKGGSWKIYWLRNKLWVEAIFIHLLTIRTSFQRMVKHSKNPLRFGSWKIGTLNPLLRHDPQQAFNNRSFFLSISKRANDKWFLSQQHAIQKWKRNLRSGYRLINLLTNGELHKGDGIIKELKHFPLH